MDKRKIPHTTLTEFFHCVFFFLSLAKISGGMIIKSPLNRIKKEDYHLFSVLFLLTIVYNFRRSALYYFAFSLFWGTLLGFTAGAAFGAGCREGAGVAACRDWP